MKKILSVSTMMVVFSGAIFGFGISLSGMANPNTVLQFLDITGAWNPALLFVMVGAVSVTYAGYRWAQSAQHPVYAEQFYIPNKKHIDSQLVIGAMLFGIGWGLTGYCPGAVLAALVRPNEQLVIFFVSMLVGMKLYTKFFEK